MTKRFICVVYVVLAIWIGKLQGNVRSGVRRWEHAPLKLPKRPYAFPTYPRETNPLWLIAKEGLDIPEVGHIVFYELLQARHTTCGEG